MGRWIEIKLYYMHFILLQFQWHQLLQPQFYIEHGGLWLVLFVVFAETGLFAGFFLPGDSLLFVSGIYCHEGVNGKPGLVYEFLRLFSLQQFNNEWIDLMVLIALISLAGIIGNTVGYKFGKKVGPTMYHWNDNLLFKKRHLRQAHDFYEKNGGGAIVIARFIPIIRTFAPIVAGIVDMNAKKFSFYNVVGCIAWVFTMIIAGHFLQQWLLKQFNFDLKQHLEIIVLGIVLITSLPVLWKLFFSGKKK